jgi:hypothetical protein
MEQSNCDEILLCKIQNKADGSHSTSRVQGWPCVPTPLILIKTYCISAYLDEHRIPVSLSTVWYGTEFPELFAEYETLLFGLYNAVISFSEGNEVKVKSAAEIMCRAKCKYDEVLCGNGQYLCEKGWSWVLNDIKWQHSRPGMWWQPEKILMTQLILSIKQECFKVSVVICKFYALFSETLFCFQPNVPLSQELFITWPRNLYSMYGQCVAQCCHFLEIPN